MCTVSVVAYDEGLRVVCNRDERRTRPAACPPVERATPAGVYVCPVDPMSGGTWIGAHRAGYAAILLNRTPVRRRRRQVATSRGLIVPRLLEAGSAAAAVGAINAFDWRAFEPFTVVLVSRTTIAAFSAGDHRSCWMLDVAAPALFTSSSLGDRFVEPVRRALFAELVADARDQLTGQERFHRHQWAAAPGVSVLMERDEAATVSRTTIDLDASGVRLDYEPVPSALAAKAA